MGCGERGFRYFTEFSNHINLRLTTQPKKQKHLKYFLVRNAQGLLVKGPLIFWNEYRGRLYAAPPPGGGPSTPGPHVATLLPLPAPDEVPGASGGPRLAGTQLGVAAERGIGGGGPGSASAPASFLATPEPFRHHSVLKPSPAFHPQAVALARPSAIAAHYGAYHVSSAIRVNGNGGGGMPGGGPAGPRGAPGGNQLSSTHLRPPSPTGVASAMDNGVSSAGPPKKRHRGWSPGSPSGVGTSGGPPPPVHHSSRTDPALAASAVPTSMVGGGVAGAAPLAGESVVVPDSLADVCGTRPVILIGHGTLPYLYGDVGDIVVSPALMSCYGSPQFPPPRAAEALGLAPSAPPLPIETQILLTLHYLAQLGGDRPPFREEFDQILLRTQQQQQQGGPDASHIHSSLGGVIVSGGGGAPGPAPPPCISPSQLPWLARLAACPSGGAVRVLATQGSLGEGLAETLGSLARSPRPAAPGRLHGGDGGAATAGAAWGPSVGGGRTTTAAARFNRPRYVVVVCTSCARGSEFCVIVTGPLQARAIAENMLSVAECLKEISYELITGKVGILASHFQCSSHERELDWLLDRFEEEREGRVFAPYGDDEGGRPLCADQEAAVALPPADTVSPPEGFRLHPAQFWVARKLLSQVCAIADAATQHLDLGRFGRVHFLLLIPPSESLYRQTLERLNQSGILADLGVEEGSQKGERYVARLDGDGQAKFEAFLHRVRRNPYTLFVLVHDQAHADTTSGASMSGSHGDVYTGLADRLVNCREAREAANLLTLQVSAAPYGLQSQHSRIAPYNEVYWPLTDPVRQEGPHLLGSEYFGLSEFRREMHSPTRLPAMRHDEAFESLAETLLERFPRLHSAVIRTYLLVRHYAAALLATAGAHGAEAQCTVETRAMLGAVAGPPCASGRGPMLLLRVPSPQLARVAYERLLDVRRRLGMSYRFEVVLAGADGVDLTVGKHFLARLRAWRGVEDSDWVPRSFQDLEDLPCILLLGGKDLCGETLPRSLKYCDLRLVSTSGVTRTALEQELGTAARYVTRATASAGKRAPSNEGRRAGAPGEGLRTRRASGEEAHSSPHSEGSTMPPTTSSSSGVAENGSSPVSSEEGSSLKSTGTGSDPKSPDALSPDIAAPPPVPPAPPAEGSASTALGTHPPVPSDPTPEPTTEPSAEISTQTGGDLKPALVNGGVGLVDERAATSRASSSPATAAAPSALHPAPPGPAEVLPPCVLLPKAVATLLRGQGGGELHALLPPAPRVGWATHLRPPPPAHAPAVAAASSAYCRLWTVARQQHCDHDNRAADGGGVGAGGSGGFHPRRLLLCGPPQVGKTGAYLQFLRVLNRMLIRLQEVDVYNEEDINQDLLEGSSSLHVSQDQWPDIEAFRKLTFDPVLRDSRFRNASPVYTPRLGSRVKSGLAERSGGAKRRTVSVTLSKFAAHNTFHHCEQCHLYTDPGPPTQAREAGLHAFTFSSAALGEEVTLHFLVPRSQEHHFVFSASGRSMHSFRLPLTTDTEDTVAVRSPIFTPSTGRHEHGLLNLHHALEGAGAAALHVVVVRAGEVPAYQRYWPNHVLLALPRHLDHTGVGLARCLVQELCRENLERERARRAAQVETAGSAAGGDGAPDAASECTAPGARPQDVWPFVLVMDDSCVMFYEAQPRRRAGATGAETSEGEMEPDGTTREPQASAGGDTVAADTERCVSLRHVLRRLEATPKATRYAVLGVRRWGGSWRAAGLPGAAGTARLHSFSRRHLHDLVLLNVELTRAITYDHNRYSCEDVDFNLRADGQALLLCCFNAFSVMKKHVGVGGHRHVPVPQAPTAAGVCAPVSPSQFVCAPDSDYTFLQAPAHLLLERYLRVAGSTLFPHAARSHAHPVLALDSYLNLGAQVSVCYASSRAAPVGPPGPFPVYSGLLLYLCDSGLTADMLRRFKFLQGATLCVICQDRSSLRQTVVRLELEEVWQFRLRDEFQTANSPGDRPLFFLTGRHV